MNAWLQQTALWTWQNSLAAAALAAVVFGMRRLFRGRIAPRWLCVAGWLVMLRLLLPAPLPHSWAWDRAWTKAAPPSFTTESSTPVAGAGGVETAAPSLAQLREEIAAAREELKTLIATGYGSIHPKVLAVRTELSVREQALATVPVASSATTTTPAVDWLAFVVWAWVAGVLGSVLFTFVRHRRFMRRLARGSEQITLPWAGLTEECTAAAGLRKVPLLFTIPGGGTPFLCGLFRPRIVLPSETLAALTLSEARHVLLHEMLHIARRDLLANWLLAALRAWHWFNPFIHAACRRLLADRELLRDAQAIALLRDPAQRSAYGHTLLKIALSLSAPAPSPGLAPLFQSEKELQRRLSMLQSPLCHRRLTTIAVLSTLAVICAPLFTTARGNDTPQTEETPVSPPPLESAAGQPEPEKPEDARPGAPDQTIPGAGGETEASRDYKSVMGKLTALEAKRNSLLTKFTSEHREVRDCEAQIEALRDRRAEMEKKYPDLVSATSSGVPETGSAAENVSEGRASLASLENLRAVAAKLREKGQAEEANAIERELKKLSADSVPSPAPSGSAPVPAGELQQLRAEMAEIKAALAALQVKRVTELGQDLDRVDNEMDALLDAGLGLRHPRILALREKMGAIQKQMASPGAPIAEAGVHENTLEQDVLKMKTQLEILANLNGEQLIAAFIELGAQNATVKKIYPEYQSEIAALRSATKSGWGPKHPKVVALRESAKTKYARLEDAVENYRKNLKVQIDQSEKMLADARKRAPDSIRRAEPVKSEDQTGENLPWGVGVPGKQGLVYTPYSPEHAIVDVNGFKKGETVKCPYTDNFFKVP